MALSHVFVETQLSARDSLSQFQECASKFLRVLGLRLLVFGFEHDRLSPRMIRRRPLGLFRFVSATGVEALVLAGALDHLGERWQLLRDLAEAYR